jgi:uncharacterized protein YcbX
MAPGADVVGRVAELWRYPVKSMAGERLDAADVSWHGFAGDRRWAFIRPGLVRSDFPWLTIRELGEMGRYRPRFREPERPDRSPTVVSTPDGDELDVADPQLAARLGEGVQLVKQNRGVFDIAPLSLISTQSIAAIGARVEAGLEVRRFRPNLVVEAAGADPFPEDGWVGASLRIGGLVMRVDQRDERCVMVNVDPATAARDPRILRTIAQEREACLGVYGTPVQPGTVRVGDPVTLVPAG